MTQAHSPQAGQLFAQGLQFHGEGDLAQAMRAYEQVLKLAPDHIDALYHVGIVGFQTGNFEMAAGFFRSVLALAPDDAAAHSNLGNALKEQQLLEEALDSYARALALNAADADTWFNRGAVLLAVGQPEDALHSFEQALTLNDADDQAWQQRAAVLRQLGQHVPALESAEQALALNPQNIEAHNQRGAILHALGRLDDAAQSLRQALALLPEYADAHHNLGLLLAAAGQLDDALHCHDQAIALQPQWHEAHASRAAVLRQLSRRDDAQRADATANKLRREQLADCRRLGEELLAQGRAPAAARHFAAALRLDDSDAVLWQLHARALNAAAQRDEALVSIGRALALKHDSAEFHLARGVILRGAARYEEALQSYQQVVQLAPRNTAGYTNLGSVQDQLGLADLAMANYERAIALDPGNALARWNRALVHLRRGDYQQGWRDYEYRWKAETLDLYKKQRDFAQPAWTGREPLAGKTILLHAEQGFGDTIQFCRYAPLLARRDAVVVLEVKPALVALMGTLEGVSSIVVKGDALPPSDYHIPLMSLPLAFDTRIDSVPAATPYLAPDAARVAHWRAALGPRTRPRVGVVWSGSAANQNDHNRSLPLPLLAALFDAPGDFISLQKEVRPDDQALLDTLPVLQLADQLRDFADTAALCAVLDLVITVDTSVAHLAGALGVPVWVMLQTPFEWRWLEQGAASPWYPSATLYRQAQRGDWTPLVEQVAADLRQLR